MEMYTEFDFNVDLKENTPELVIKTLQFMVGYTEEEPKDLPDYPLFTTGTGWRFMLTCGSCYFSARPHSVCAFDSIQKNFYLNIRCNLKNYSNEIALFVSWITPYIDANEGDFLGFFRYEEETKPTLIYLGENMKKNPNDMINLDVMAFRSKQANSIKKNFETVDLIQSYQNGLTKGFLNGLDIACKWLEDNNYPLASSELSIFVGRTKDEQLEKEQSTKR